MRWLEKYLNKPLKKPERKTQVVTPYCSKCENEIVCLDVSIGEVIEDQGAFLYTGSEGKLYEPLYGGSICTGCGIKLCDDCLEEVLDKSRCPKCGGALRVISPKRLPKA